MKQRIISLTFVLKSRGEKDRRIDSQFKNTLNELLGDASHYGSEIILRKIIMSQIALELAQNPGIDYHVSTKELCYYMGKKDVETHIELMHTVKSIIDKKIKQCESYSKTTIILAKNVSRQQAIFDKICI